MSSQAEVALTSPSYTPTSPTSQEPETKKRKELESDEIKEEKKSKRIECQKCKEAPVVKCGSRDGGPNKGHSSGCEKDLCEDHQFACSCVYPIKWCRDCHDECTCQLCSWNIESSEEHESDSE